VAFYGASLVIGLGALTAMFMINNPKPMYALVGPMNTAFDLAALIFAIVICRRTGLRLQTRRAWKWLAASAFVRLLSVIAYAAFLNWPHFPAPGDLLRLLMVPLTMAALLALPRRSGGRLEWHKLLLDVTAVFAGGAMLMWYFVAGPAIAARNLPADTVAAAIALPIGDLAMIFGVLVAIRRGVDPVVRRPLFLFAGGLLAEIAGTSYLGYTLTHEHSTGKLAWQLGCWLVGHFLLAAAAYEQLRHRRSAEEPETIRSLQRISRTLYVGVGMCIVLLITAPCAKIRPPRGAGWSPAQW
jgi:hypothetical protein